ncbi:MAG: T9SS type A sorting domain-containing protein [Flavobacteriales bacterium]|nr:T9SS type A sorting domain-containing protein [Flavobacteriales bacterium]MDG1781889.1 T9SS type A sorting domain-containing protein [Flavobacteriales bacterium]MDG2246898.1 T9SS type A sorting domain-containing protein [Flavobacteriales bacterium]
MRYIYFSFFLLFSTSTSLAQDYVSYFTGDEADAQVTPTFGVVLMGGAGENDEAMKWFLERANGGDVVVLRASGSDGYNDYLFSDLGVEVNSVETILFNSGDAATDEYVIQQVQNAEAIWMAGGDQWNYVSYWQGTAIEDAINTLLNETGGVVGGISAGMAVLGGTYFNASLGTVTSEDALENPFDNQVQLGHNDFIEAPFLEDVVTDTHYDDPDRKGRHVTFMARMAVDEGKVPKGISCDEFAAVCIDENGLATCFGEAPDYDDYVYFVRPNCTGEINPQVCEEGIPLTWDEGDEALKVLRINANLAGDFYLDLNNWTNFNGGEWFDWYVDEGALVEAAGEAPDCSLYTAELEVNDLQVWPVPTERVINFQASNGEEVLLMNIQGEVLKRTTAKEGFNQIDLSELSEGIYFLKMHGVTQRIVKVS